VKPGAGLIRQRPPLQSQAPPMGWSFVRRRMTAELGLGWESRFARFEHAAAAATSLGQVHHATDRDGRCLACKLQYPAMAEAVGADLSALDLVLRLLEQYQHALGMGEVHGRAGSAAARGARLWAGGSPHGALPRHAPWRGEDPHAGAGAGAQHRQAAHHDLARGRADPERVPADARGAGRACHDHVPGLVCALLRARRDPRRSPPRQLHRGTRHHAQSARLRLRARLPAGARPGRGRPVSGAVPGRRGARRPGLPDVGLPPPHPAGDGRLEHLGTVPVRALSRTGSGPSGISPGTSTAATPPSG
jgi:hypothetical protein